MLLTPRYRSDDEDLHARYYMIRSLFFMVNHGAVEGNTEIRFQPKHRRANVGEHFGIDNHHRAGYSQR